MLDEDYLKIFDLDTLDYPKIVKAIKEMEDISTYKLADKVGVSQSTITRIERGKQKPRQKMRKKLFNLFSHSAMTKLSEGNSIDGAFNVDDLSKNPTLMQALANIHIPIEEITKANPDRVKRLAEVGYWASVMLLPTKTDKLERDS